MTDKFDLSLDTRMMRSPTVLSSDMGDEFVMMDIESGLYFNLKDVGAAVWVEIETEITFGEVLTRLTEQFEVDRATCEAEMREFVKQLVELKMVTLS